MEMITLDMTISKEMGQFLLRHQFKDIKNVSNYSGTTHYDSLQGGILARSKGQS